MSCICPVAQEQVLSFDLAIVAAAEQNFDRDVRMRFLNETKWEAEKLTYLGDAFDFLSTKGANNTPHYPDHPQIRVPKDSPATHLTDRALAFQEALDEWYKNYNAAWRAGRDYNQPKPIASDFGS